MRILLVDDEQGIRRMLGSYLESLGHELLLAENGLEARSLLESLDPKPDVIVLDNKMPVMDGMTFLKELVPGEQKIPIIMMTGHSELEFEAVAPFGVVEVIEKPFSFVDITRALEALPASLREEASTALSHQS